MDAIGVYSKIDADHGVKNLNRWLTQYCHKLPNLVPVDFIRASLEEIMKNKIFQFGYT
jgi:hypothetical protein